MLVLATVLGVVAIAAGIGCALLYQRLQQAKNARKEAEERAQHYLQLFRISASEHRELRRRIQYYRFEELVHPEVHHTFLKEGLIKERTQSHVVQALLDGIRPAVQVIEDKDSYTGYPRLRAEVWVVDMRGFPIP